MNRNNTGCATDGMTDLELLNRIIERLDPKGLTKYYIKVLSRRIG